MNKSAALLAIFCIVAVATGQDCPSCGPPQDPIVPCGAPDCSLPENQQNSALFPHPDPNFFWQCAPTGNSWQPLARPCACGTVFNVFVEPRRCTFWWSDKWSPICNWVRPPTLNPCTPWCPDCNGSSSTPPTPTPPTPPAPTPDDPIITPTPDPCPPCPPCPPCVWWPWYV